MNRNYFSISLPFKKSICVLLLAAGVYIIASSFKSNDAKMNSPVTDSLLSKKAFLSVYDVLMSPRCMNCHPSGDVPLVGEESKLHTQSVKRGKEGKGLYAVKCSNCHADKNQPSLNMPPGNPNWHMPPANMKMVFQGKTPRALAALLLDPTANGKKSKADLIKHVSADGLVLAGWNAGEGRKQPPLSHNEFVKQFKLWIDNGAYLPD